MDLIISLIPLLPLAGFILIGVLNKKLPRFGRNNQQYCCPWFIYHFVLSFLSFLKGADSYSTELLMD